MRHLGVELNNETLTMLPHARIMVDKFHVIRMVSDVLEKIRKGLRNELTASQRQILKRE